MISGIINVNKPTGITSHQVVARLRKILKEKKVGHTGTLDPLAVGVLPICVGNATRIIEYLDTTKAYRAHILLGVKTDTYDIEGNIIKKVEVKPDKAPIEDALEDFRGEIVQIPPMHSAVHYKGKRLYEYARKNIEIADIPKRTVFIDDIKLVGIEGSTAIVDIDCSGGTYIRTIAYDLGEKLGCGACIEQLIRTRAGEFRIEDSYTLEELEHKDPEEFLIPAQEVLSLESIELNDEQSNKLHKGQYFFIDRVSEDEKLVQLIYEDNLAGIANLQNNKIKPVKVFC